MSLQLDDYLTYISSLKTLTQAKQELRNKVVEVEQAKCNFVKASFKFKEIYKKFVMESTMREISEFYNKLDSKEGTKEKQVEFSKDKMVRTPKKKKAQ